MEQSSVAPSDSGQSGTDPASVMLPIHMQVPGLHAGFWMRVAAYLLDYLILLLATFAMGLIVAALKSMGPFRNECMTAAQIMVLPEKWWRL